MNAEQKRRCAIYTWVPSASTMGEDSANGQRSLAEAYIKSIEKAGWMCLKKCYDDVGITRPTKRVALKCLLEDIREGEIHCVLLFHVDRISECFPDFMEIVKQIEESHVIVISLHMEKEKLKKEESR